MSRAQMKVLQHLDVTDDPDEMFEVLLRDGAIIVENVLTPFQIDNVWNELEPFSEAADPRMRNVYDFYMGAAIEEERKIRRQAEAEAAAKGEVPAAPTRNTRNVTGLSSKSNTFATEVLVHPLYVSICDRLFGPKSDGYLLNHSHLINRGPGAVAQPIHRDEAIWARVPSLGVGSHFLFASILALVDFDEENGATNVVPGSHLWEGNATGTVGRTPEPDEVLRAVMPAGSAVLYLGWTFHGAGANVTEDFWRRALHVSYCQSWLRTEENNTLATPPDIARHLPAEAQALLGYQVHGGLGMLELRSPVDQMRDGVI
jgi:ectoine hydroxylase-related dioxygenase (phytanoyl-CoA dioxygenase family)